MGKPAKNRPIPPQHVLLRIQPTLEFISVHAGDRLGQSEFVKVALYHDAVEFFDVVSESNAIAVRATNNLASLVRSGSDPCACFGARGEKRQSHCARKMPYGDAVVSQPDTDPRHGFICRCVEWRCPFSYPEDQLECLVIGGIYSAVVSVQKDQRDRKRGPLVPIVKAWFIASEWKSAAAFNSTDPYSPGHRTTSTGGRVLSAEAFRRARRKGLSDLALTRTS